MFPNKGNKSGGEQFLDSYETCCLAELFLPNITSKEELFDCTTLLYRICKHSLLLKSHHLSTEEIVHENMRMGIGISGAAQAVDKLNWLSECYEYLRDFDEEYSEFLGVPTSIKLTTVKPSGTLSLLPGITPGAHPGIARFMKRRIRIAADHELVGLCRKNGYDIEYLKNFDGTFDYGTVVVTFPFSYPKGTIVANDWTAIDQLNFVRRLQKIWSDNSVSCTVYYRKEELPLIQKYLSEYYEKSHKSLSFLQQVDHGFDQAPFEEITEDEYNKLVKCVKPITSFSEYLYMDESSECVGGGCPLR